MKKLSCSMMYVFYICLKIVVKTAGESITAMFSHDLLCDASERQKYGCMINRGARTRRGLIACATLCAHEDLCMGVSLDPAGVCYTHTPCQQLQTCSVVDTSQVLYTKRSHCRHDGVWDENTATCKCVDGWIGTACERLASTCEELYNSGYDDKQHWVTLDIYKDRSRLIRTRCGIENKVRTLLIMNNGREGHNRPYQDFVTGYKIDDFNFWIGLENMVHLNRLGYTRLVMGTLFGTSPISKYIDVYTGFNINDASQGYSFGFSSVGSTYQGNMGTTYTKVDCLGPVRGTPFSAFDNDNDGDPQENCSNKSGTGWWFLPCSQRTSVYPCNPMGWNLMTKPGIPPWQLLELPNLNMSDPAIANSFLRTQIHATLP